MKAISLWQPWASAIALGAKRIETRHWSTRYRGPLAIHAAKRVNKNELIYYACCWNWCGAMRRDFGTGPMWETLPFGAIVATCDLTDCRPTGSFRGGELDEPRYPDRGGFARDGTRQIHAAYAWTERQMGDFGLGRYGWVLENIVALPKPLPCKGSQGFFEVRL